MVMKKNKMLILVVIGLLLLGATTVFAAELKTPAQIYAGLKGITEQEAIIERSEGEPYGVMAEDEGFGDEFKDAMLESKKAVLNQRVEEGILTQDQADAIMERIEQNIENCNGPGSCGNIGGMYGAGFGNGSRGNGLGQGGYGRGMRLR
jgi:hypothetical protein